VDVFLGTAKSPVVIDSVYNGEWYDARLEQPGWAKSGFVPSPDGGWTSVTVLDTSCFNPILTPISFPGIGVDFVNSPVNVSNGCVFEVAEPP
jgi:Alpha-L-rhamnosidase N-terminal domain